MTPWLCLCFCRWSTFRFFGPWRISAMSDRRHHGEGEHGHGNVTMPAMPGSALVVIEPEFVFRGLETVLDRPGGKCSRDKPLSLSRSQDCLGRGHEPALLHSELRTMNLRHVVVTD